VVLNACHTRALGVALRATGVAHVVCWHGTVLDSHAIKFAEEFFEELATSPTEYKEAFEVGQRAVSRLYPRAVRRLCFLSATLLVDVDDELLDRPHELCNEAVMPQHVAGQSAGGGAGGAGGGDGGADVARMLNNAKGRAELNGFRSLGVALKFHGNDIEEGIRKYEASQIDGRRVREYGLDESHYDLWIDSNRVAGKKLLMIRTAALQHMFGDVSISDYASLWKVGGAVDKKAQQADSIARETAVGHFRDSLNARQQQRGGDRGHQYMLDEMRHCIERLERLVRDDRCSQTLKQNKVFSTPCPSVYMYVYMYVCMNIEG